MFERSIHSVTHLEHNKSRRGSGFNLTIFFFHVCFYLSESQTRCVMCNSDFTLKRAELLCCPAQQQKCSDKSLTQNIFQKGSNRLRSETHK